MCLFFFYLSVSSFLVNLASDSTQVGRVQWQWILFVSCADDTGAASFYLISYFYCCSNADFYDAPFGDTNVQSSLCSEGTAVQCIPWPSWMKLGGAWWKRALDIDWPIWECGDWQLNWILITFLVFIYSRCRHRRAVATFRHTVVPPGPRTCKRTAWPVDCPRPVSHRRIVRIQFHPVSGC